MDRIMLGHGSGGKLMQGLIKSIFQPEFGLSNLGDSAIIFDSDSYSDNKGFRQAFTTDSFVVSPIFFPGGNIGELAVNGTVNDLSVAGAIPLYLSAGFILEEGFPLDDLKKIVKAMSEAAKKAGVKIVAGDTKVVEKGKADGLFINTSGIGIIPEGVNLGPERIMPGDKIIVSGLIGEHGVAVLSKRHGLSFEPSVLSDTAPLNGLVQQMLRCSSSIKMMRDPTRGGVATALKEIALESGLPLVIYEEFLPYSAGVKGACELLGIDILHVANEGILIAVVSPQASYAILDIMKNNPLGRNSAVIGEAGEHDPKLDGVVMLRTSIGGTRVVDMPYGEQLPRIC
jgi:hydrogenase expression/formation protein HypE